MTLEGANGLHARLSRRATLVFGCGLATLALAWAFTNWQADAIARRFPAKGAFIGMDERGARLHYAERGPSGPERGTVVLLHGASGNQADLMVPLGAALASRGFRVIAVDRPGHGWSDRPDGENDARLSRQAALIRAALERLGVRHAIVLGHSLAGALAADFALQHGDFTVGVVLVAPVLYPWSTGIAWYHQAAASPWFGPLFTRVFSLPAGRALLPAGIAEVFSPQRPPEGFERRTGVELLLRPAEFEANSQDVSRLLDFVTAQAPRMGAIAVPVAIVAGDGDRVVSSEIHAANAARDIPGARLTILPGTGHSPHWTAPEAVIAAVLDVADRSGVKTAAAPREFGRRTEGL